MTMAKKTNLVIEKGSAHPLGATPDAEGVNFSIFSENASGVELCLFDRHDDLHPFMTVCLDPYVNRTFHFWHVYVRGLKHGTHYAYRIDGEYAPDKGHLFNRNKVAIDPYARGNTDCLFDRAEACNDGDNIRTSMRSVVIDVNRYDWEGDKSPVIPMKDSIIYEMHVRGFTRDVSSGVKHPGTFSGVIEKIPHLKSLGVTAVELLPVFEFDSSYPLRTGPDGSELVNYWGYSTVGFFAPESSYCSKPEFGEHLNEFRDMVKALHNAGIEIILDVVFNHTDEGNHQGPVISFKAIDNAVYYHLVDNDKRYYMDYTGCGNTVNCNHPIVEKFITDCLEFWVKDMHVDGFRFDEGSILSRGEDGKPLAHAPVIWNIELMDTFADTKLIAEAWDAAGVYQIGSFPGYRWAEWNGIYRDQVRRFVKGDGGIVGGVAAKISGSSDIYQHNRHTPVNSINFVTCHDGFTMIDLVSYNEKHNFANGEENRDGNDNNDSWNHGVEGETDDPAINELRKREIKNFAAILMLSQGVPMILSGDEFGHTQQGNNNTYCQDNRLNWIDWSLGEKNADLLSFFTGMIKLRKALPSLRRGTFFNGTIVNDRGLKDVDWHGCKLHAPGWNDPECRVLAFTLGGTGEAEPDLHVMLNMSMEELAFDIPPIRSRNWALYADTSLPSPQDIAEFGKEKKVNGSTYKVKAHSSVILISKKTR